MVGCDPVSLAGSRGPWMVLPLSPPLSSHAVMLTGAASAPRASTLQFKDPAGWYGPVSLHRGLIHHPHPTQQPGFGVTASSVLLFFSGFRKPQAQEPMYLPDSSLSRTQP